MKCLQKDKAQRYQGGAELAADLGHFIRGEPIAARPISRPERVWRWCKRNPRMATATGIAAALALIVMIGGPVSALMINEQKKLADTNAKAAVDAKGLAQKNEQKAIVNEEKAVENAEAASVQEKNAIDALKSLVFVVQRKMAGRSDLIELRESLLETVRNGLTRMDKNQNNARSQNMIAAGIHVRLGDINMEIGRPAKAYEEYQSCLAIFKALGAEVPYRESNQSKIYQLLGDAARKMGDYQTADEHYRQSLKIRRQWVAKTPTLKSTSMLATSLGKLGSLAQVRGDLKAARKYMEEAVEVRSKIREQNPNETSAFTELLGADLVLGKVMFQQGETEQGLSKLAEIVGPMREHADSNPHTDDPRQNAAMFDAELAVMQLYLGDLEQADANFGNAVAVLEKLKKKNPHEIRVHQECEEALYGLAVTRDEVDKGSAQDLLSRLLELRRQSLSLDETNVMSKLRLLPVLARAGEVVEAAKLAGELEAAVSETDTSRYDLACGYAQLSAARAELPDSEETKSLPSVQTLQKSALKALQQALDAGFYRYTDLRLDPDLDPIRDLPEFQKLIDSGE